MKFYKLLIALTLAMSSLANAKQVDADCMKMLEIFAANTEVAGQSDGIAKGVKRMNDFFLNEAGLNINRYDREWLEKPYREITQVVRGTESSSRKLAQEAKDSLIEYCLSK